MPFANQQPVATLILERLGATLELTLTALAFASVIQDRVRRRRAAPPAVLGRGLVDSAIQGTSSGQVIPGLLARPAADLVFAIWLGWLPRKATAPVRGTLPGFDGFVQHLSTWCCRPLRCRCATSR